MHGAAKERIDYRRRRSAALIAIILFAAPMTAPFAQIMQQRVIFADGSGMVTLKGTLKGPIDYVRDYIFSVKAGQMLSVTLLASNEATTFFNVLPPGGGKPLYRGEVERKSTWEWQAEIDGDYVVRISLNRAARKGPETPYEITITRL